MNENLKKVVGDLLPQLLMFLVLAVFTGYHSEAAVAGWKYAGIAIACHVGWAPVYYMYLQRRTHKEAAAEEQRRREWEADAPNRAVRLAVAKAIAGYADANPKGPAHA